MLAGEAIPAPLDGHDEWQNIIHTDDLTRQTPLLWDLAATTPPVVNWAGDHVISIRQMVDHIAELTGTSPRWERSENTLRPKASNNDRRRALIGDCRVSWRSGIRRSIEAHFPDAVRGE